MDEVISRKSFSIAASQIERFARVSRRAEIKSFESRGRLEKTVRPKGRSPAEIEVK
jgi:hypothetical protein